MSHFVVNIFCGNYSQVVYYSISSKFPRQRLKGSAFLYRTTLPFWPLSGRERSPCFSSSDGVVWLINRTIMLKQSSCAHLLTLTVIRPARDYVCDECVKTGDSWVHLRMCQSCGTTLCCDSSPNKHATKHFHASAHPVVISAEPGERWLWCYADEQMAGY